MADTTAIILAGGRSSRMGEPKALLPFDGEPLIAHIVSLLALVCQEIVVVAAPEQTLPPLPATLVRDEVAYQGPVGGIAYGLAAAHGDACFVTSCDSVFLNRALVSHLVSLSEGHDVVVPVWDGRLQPLHAVYRRQVLPLVQEQLARQELRPVYLFDKVRTRRIDEDEIRRFDPEGLSFFNMNTPDDYAAALERWPEWRREHKPASGKSFVCTVELFGVPRLLAKATDIPVSVPPSATVADVLAALADIAPALVGRVIRPDRTGLVEGFACNVNGVEWVRTFTTRINPNDHLVVFSADAGG